jgi:hypothetical protein
MRRALLSAIAAVLISSSPALATPTQIDVYHGFFAPKVLTVPLGTFVYWHDGDCGSYIVQMNKDFYLGGALLNGCNDNDGQVSMGYAGTFGYHLANNSSVTGSVEVRIRASQSGTTQTHFPIRYADVPSVPSNLRFDVQRRKPGGDWKVWLSGVSAQYWTFKTDVTGVWKFRARVRRTSDNAHSGWSPAFPITVTNP